MRGIVFDIKRFAVHDGPGIRSTVFTKGCPLYCFWCQNPEGKINRINLWYYNNKCIHCGRCIKTCPNDALSENSKNCSIQIDHKKCQRSGKCVEVCPSKALVLDGKEMESSEVVSELLKDKIFYETSGGGVTVSGGEPTVQYEFNLEILKSCKDEGICTAIESCLYVRPEILDKFIGVTDLFIIDIKLYDGELHRQYTGFSNELIKNNFERLVKREVDILVRIPIVPGYTATVENISSIGSYVSEIGSNIPVELINYNSLAENKYRLMGRELKSGMHLKPYPNTELERFQIILKTSGIKNIVEG